MLTVSSIPSCAPKRGTWSPRAHGLPCPAARRQAPAPCRVKPGPRENFNAPSWIDEPLKHVVESQQFNKESLSEIFRVAREMEGVRPGTPESKCLEGAVMSTLFYEPSTRTRLSFEAAMGRLGGTVLSTESAGEFSSAAKGETLEGACWRGLWWWEEGWRLPLRCTGI